jgi:hypothetical protein
VDRGHDPIRKDRHVKTRTVLAATLALTLSVTSASLADQKAEVDRDVEALLDVTGAFALAQQMMHSMFQTFAQSNPSVPQKFWTDMEKRFKKEDFYVLLTPIYRKHMSPADIKELLTFYRSPLGQRVIKALPLITQDSIAVGQMWGKKVANDVKAEAKRRGYDI